MEDCFDFDLDFFEQNQPTTGECGDADVRELARRIADTDNLVQTINSLRSENDLVKRQLIELTNSVSEVQLMYQKESFRVCELQLANDKLSSQSDTAQKEILALQGEKVQKSLYYNQLEEEWRNSLEEEKKRYKALEAKFNELHDKYQKHSKEQNDVSDSKSQPKKKCENILPSPGKKRDSNKASRMVSRGTQYQSSTTTRATCTSAFIKKQNVGVNFPEVVPIAIEDIFLDTLMDIPNVLSPIQDIVDPSFSVCTQTESPVKSTVSIGTCTDLCNVRNEVNYVSEKSTRGVKRDIDWEKEIKRSHPQLSDLWELLGQTIFALIRNNGCCSANFEDFASRIEGIRSHYEGDGRVSSYFHGNKTFPGVNIPKKEVNTSSCSSPAPDNPRTTQHESNAADEPTGFDRNDSHEFEHLKGESDDIDFRSYEGCPKQSIPDETDPPDKNIEDEILKDACVVISSPLDSHSDLELSAIKEEFAMLDKKLLVISPIRNSPQKQLSKNLQVKQNLTDKINKREGCEVSAFKTPNLKDRTAQSSISSCNTTNSASTGMQCKTTAQSRAEIRLERKRVKRRLKRRNAKIYKQMAKRISNTPTAAEDLKAAVLKYSIDWQRESIEEIAKVEKADIENNYSSIESNKRLSPTTVSGNDSTSSFEMVPSFKRSKVENIGDVSLSNNRKMTTSDTICIDDTLKADSDRPNLKLSEISVKSDGEEMNHISNALQTYENTKQHLDFASSKDCLDSRSSESWIDESARNSSLSKSAEGMNVGIVESSQPLPVATAKDISLSDESDEELFYGFPLDETPKFDEVKIPALSQEESPQSPDMFEEISADNYVREIPLEREIEYDSDYSPASPFFKHADPSQIPQEIPLDRIGYNTNKIRSILGHYLAEYSAPKHRLCSKKSRSETVAEGKLLWLLRKIMERYLLGPGDAVECKKCAKRVARRTVGKNQILITAICEITEDTKDEITNDFTPPAPVMTKSHMKILLLIKALNRFVIGIESELLFALDQRIFNLKTEKVNLNVLINLFLLYIGIIDTQDLEVHPARLIMYKSLYYYSKMANPLIYYVLVTYPAALPKKSDPDYDNSDPLVSTLQAILNSQQYDVGKGDLKERELYHMLQLYYEYERVKPSREEVVELLLSKIRSDSFRNVNYSFALLCKRNGVKWSTQYVLSDKLLPLLGEYANLLKETEDHDKKVACILDCISAVLKPFPATCDIGIYRQMFVNVLYETNRQIVQEAAVLSILRTARFGYEQCFKLIYQWKPAYKLSKVLSLSLDTFVHRSTLRKLKMLERQVKID